MKEQNPENTAVRIAESDVPRPRKTLQEIQRYSESELEELQHRCELLGNRWLWQRCLETPGRTKNKGFWSQQGNCHSWKERDEETALLLWIPSCAASEPVYESFHSHMRTHLGQWLEYLLICRVVRRIQYIGNNDNKYYYKGKDLWDASRDTAMLVSSGHSLWNSKYSIPIFYISLAFGQLIFIIHLISRQHEY